VVIARFFVAALIASTVLSAPVARADEPQCVPYYWYSVCRYPDDTLFVDGGSHINGVAWTPDLDAAP
jgi:hypothetical protein